MLRHATFGMLLLVCAAVVVAASSRGLKQAPAASDAALAGVSISSFDMHGGQCQPVGGYPSLTDKWWQWFFTMPPGNNHPVFDTTGRSCGRNQQLLSADTWFLVGTLGGPAVTRSCTVPAGFNILIPLYNTERSKAEGHGQTDQELRASANAYITGVDPTTLKAKLDTYEPYPFFREESKQAFYFRWKVQWKDYGFTGANPTPAWADGYWAYIPASCLQRGPHTLHVEGGKDSSKQDVTYKLSIV